MILHTFFYQVLLRVIELLMRHSAILTMRFFNSNWMWA